MDSTGELLKFLLERIHGENGLPMQDLRDCCHSITFKIGDKKGADSFESTPLAERKGFEPLPGD